jgi:hypothetical protein
MPPRKPKITPNGLELVQRLKTAIRDTNQLCVTHRILVDLRDGSTPLLFTVDLIREPGGMYLATCWQLSQVLVAGLTEEDALAKAEGDIRILLQVRRS